MALYPFILISKRSYKTRSDLILHERIHLRQQIEMLVIPFYIVYVINYLVNLIKYKDHFSAYINICFEREAYQNDRFSDYLKTRKFWSFLKYLHKK